MYSIGDIFFSFIYFFFFFFVVNIVYYVVHIVCEVDVIANSLVLYLPFCSTLNKNFFSSSLLFCTGEILPNNAIDSYRRVDKIDGGKEAICLYFDYRNAFDSVPRMRLMRKVESCGIIEQVQRWIKSFQQGRRQRVRVGEAVSGRTSVS